MSVFARFVAFEAVGWAVVAVVLYVCAQLDVVSTGLAWLIFVLFVAKDFVLFPLTKRAYETGPTYGSAELVGTEVDVVEAVDPEGYVMAGNERWKARLAPGCEVPLVAGALARVRALDGITLLVEPLVGRDPSG